MSSLILTEHYGRDYHPLPVTFAVHPFGGVDVRNGAIAMLAALASFAGACSSGTTTLTTAAPTAHAPATITTTLSDPPTSAVPAAPALDRNDIANFVTASGLVPALTQPADCLGAAGVCLGQPVDSLADRLRSEDQRYGQPAAEYRTWSQSGWTLNTRSDESGTITQVWAGVDGNAVVAASDGALIGFTTIGEMRDTTFATECYGGFEGQVGFFYTYPGDAEGSTIISFGSSFRVGDPGTPERFGPEVDAMPIGEFEASTTGRPCEPSPP